MCGSVSSARKKASSIGETSTGLSVGDTIFPDETYDIVRELTPSEAYTIVRELAPKAVIGLTTRVRAADVNQRTIENGSVCKAVWANHLGAVVQVDHAECEVAVVVRHGRAFYMKSKRYPTVEGGHGMCNFMYR